VLLGSFLVPITMVVFALSRPRVNHLTIEVVLLGFLGGGTLGLCFAALTEVYILPTAYGTFFGVGLIEESAKAIVFLAAARGLATRHPREGMILGATVGAGSGLCASGAAWAAASRPPRPKRRRGAPTRSHRR
jgi:protease PrsW